MATAPANPTLRDAPRLANVDPDAQTVGCANQASPAVYAPTSAGFPGDTPTPRTRHSVMPTRPFTVGPSAQTVGGANQASPAACTLDPQ
eukprot:COSAG01_NODE_2326_length_7903_cov_22.624552_12_plen_88_part_01